MVVDGKVANYYYVYLLDSASVEDILDYCAQNPCDENLLDDLNLGMGVFISHDWEPYEGYDELFLETSSEPEVTYSLCTLHQGIFISPSGAEYRIVARIHTQQITVNDEPLVIIQFLPMYVWLDNTSATADSASRVLEITHDEFTKYPPPKPTYGKGIPKFASIHTPEGEPGAYPGEVDYAGPREVSDAVKACLIARKGCARIEGRKVVVCKTRCTDDIRFETWACAICWTTGILAPFCAGACIFGMIQRERSCHRTCVSIHANGVTRCGMNSQICCLQAGGCGDQAK